MIGDAIGAVQEALEAYLRPLSKGSVVRDGQIGKAAPWRPHIFQQSERVGWYVHTNVPQSNFWQERVQQACKLDSKLAIGIAATETALSSAEFLLACHAVRAKVLLIKERKDGFLVEHSFGSIPDFICEKRIRLDVVTARSMLDVALVHALEAKTTVEKGVTLEVLVALVLSQVDNFEVHDIGISNRTQQMDVLVHNRSVSGVLNSSPLVLAEAKNWRTEKVTPTEHASFVRKLETRNKRAKLGFLVTTGKFTAGVALEARRDSKGETVVVCVDGDGLPKIWRDSQRGITQQIENLVIAATVGS